jgi:hypothetical protein
MGWFDWLRPKKPAPAPLPPHLQEALATPPRLLHEVDPDDPPAGPTLVLPQDADPDAVTQVLQARGLDPDSAMQVHPDIGLVILTLLDPDDLAHVAEQLGWVHSVAAFRRLDDDDPRTVCWAIQAADAYDAVGLGPRLVGLKRHADEGVRDCAAAVDRRRQMADALAQRARKKGKKKR